MAHTPHALSDAAWNEYLRRWRQGAYRPTFFRDMILADIERRGPRTAVLDIGCGRGFDGDPEIQQSLAASAGQYIGIEPDASVSLAECFTQVHRCLLEDAPIAAASIDVAFAVFVVEHLPRPRTFFDKLHDVLVHGGVFWGFTIDLRHCFALVSLAADGLGAKDWCLKRIGVAHTVRGGHYRAFYRANTPRALRRCASRFRSVRLMNLHQEGQFDAYLPRWARPGSRLLDRLTAALGLPGPMLVIRLEK